MATARPNPFRFLALAWRGVRRVPGVWLIRGAFEGLTYLYRLGLVFGLGLLFVLHLGSHVRGGHGLESWPAALAHTLGQPHTVAAIAGLAGVAWAMLLAVESFAYAGMWSATRAAVLDQNPRRWASVWSGAFETFGRALGVRLLVRASELALVATIVGSLLLFAAAANHVAHWTGSELLAPALTWAALLTIGSVAAVVVRLTAEVVAAAVYVDDVGLGEGIVRAAGTVVSDPVFVYRLFIVSASVLLGPLAIAWLAAMGQNVLFVIDAPLGASLLRVAAEIALLAGLAIFSVMMHATFFSYYAWGQRRIETKSMEENAVELAELLPQTYEHIADVDEILAPWDDADVEALDQARSRAAPARKPRAPAGSYNLGGILRRRTDDGEEE